MDIARIRNDARAFGWPTVLTAQTVAAVNRVIALSLLRCMRISVIDPTFLQVPSTYNHGFLNEATIRRLASSPLFDMSDSFVTEAIAKGDRCYGVLDGDRLISVTWYSTRPTKVSDDLLFQFPAGYIYMYKGFTHPDYRGKRLHGIGKTCALKEYLAQGFRGVVFYVQSTNFNSLRSAHRIGAEELGRIYVTKLLERYLIRADQGCRLFGLSVLSTN